MMETGERKNLLRVGTPLCGLVCGIVGAVIALALLLLGFWRALFVALFFAAGYFVGAYRNKTEIIKGWINRLFPPKGE